jgi:hypothetical protein
MDSMMSKSVRAKIVLIGIIWGLLAFSVSASSSVSPSADRILQDISFLASDELEGRLAGTPGADAAAEYIAESFKSAGLTPGNPSTGDYFQNFEITTSVSLGSPNAVDIKVADQTHSLVAGTDFMPLFLSGDGSVSGDVVFAGYGITAPEYNWDDYKDLDVQGKVVFILRNEPRPDDPESPFDGNRPTIHATIQWKVTNALSHGAVAVLLATGPAHLEEGEQDEFIGLDAHGSLGEAGIPVVQLSQGAVGILWGGMDAPLAMYQSMMDAHMMSFGTPLEGVSAGVTVNLIREKAQTANVIGILPGSDPTLSGEYVVVGAHYDHLGYGTSASLYEGSDRRIHNGADDNASGTAALMELARIFGSDPERPARSIVFIAFSGEELGLLGSTEYVEHPIAPLDKTSAMINMDMVGRIRPDDNGVPVCYVYGLGTASGWDSLVPDKTPDGAVSLVKFSNPLAGGDYVPFLMQRIPNLNFTSGSHEQMHRPTDDVELINEDGEASLVGAICEVLRGVANLPSMLTFQETGAGPAPITNETGTDSYTVYLGVIPDFIRTEGGFWISGVNPGSPADTAGLQGGDQITRLGDYEVSDIYNFTWALGQFKPGDTTTVTINRNGRELVLDVTFAARE